jgi:ectoine hydroxylase-related dioxygenase (phytanoyl-CoA dioxygenase family)
MPATAVLKKKLGEDGFAITGEVFSPAAINQLLQVIAATSHQKETFRKTRDLFAIRQFIKEVPAAAACIFTASFKSLLKEIIGDGYFVVKSIYFDKPPASNWFVSFHQDLTISVDKKIQLPGFGPWTVKQDQFAVQPPVQLLNDNFTARIHLDTTTEANGALKVIPGSHQHGIVRPETADLSDPFTCEVLKGAVMFMKPLLLHASGRTVNNESRRVIHIEFSRLQLPGQLQWPEYYPYAERIS